MTLSPIHVMLGQASVASSQLKLEFDSHADVSVAGDNCLVIHDHNRPVSVFHYDPKDGQRSAKTIDAVVGYQDPQNEQKFTLMINQADMV